MRKVRAAELNRINIHNSYNIAELMGEKLYLCYIRESRILPARWSVNGIKIMTDPMEKSWYDRGCKTFTVSGKRDKDIQLQVAKNWVKDKFQIDLTDRDVWGGWHRAGTLRELRSLIDLINSPKPEGSS